VAVPPNLAIVDPEPGGFPPVFTAICCIHSREGSGTGFFVGERANVVTARHVVCNKDAGGLSPDECPILVSWVLLGKSFLFHALATIVRVDPASDLALLRLLNPEEFPRPLSLDSLTRLSSTEAVAGDYVYFDAFRRMPDKSYEMRRVHGRVKQGTINPGDGNQLRFLMLDAKGWPGASGSPVFSTRGEVIGVLTAGLRDTGEAVVQDVRWVWPLFEKSFPGSQRRPLATVVPIPRAPRFAPYDGPYPEPVGVWLRRVWARLSSRVKPVPANPT
jgi:S1-C subfamily serine protease